MITSTHAQVLDWLLEPENPSVHARTLTELLHFPESDLQVIEARAAILKSPAVIKIFDAMQPGGYWLHNGKGAGIEYSGCATTHYVLSYLSELGLDRTDARIAQAVERYLCLSQPDNDKPAPWQIPPDYRNHQSCLYAYNLRTFLRLGYRDDARIQERVQILLQDSRLDGGYLCDRTRFRPKTKSCIRGSLKALMAFAELPEHWDSPRCHQLVEYFLKRRLLYRMREPNVIVRAEVTRLSFPFAYHFSLVEPLYALSKMGYGRREELGPAWDLLDSKRDAQGRYLLDWQPNTGIDFGKASAPSKWVTLYALLAHQYRET